jgi:phosphoribosylamine---glycine ligase
MGVAPLCPCNLSYFAPKSDRMTLNVLLLGSGGREHALAWKISQSTLLNKLYIAPGNPGMASCGTLVDLNPMQFGSVVNFCAKNQIDMVVIGPEAPLAAGLTDFIKADKKTSHVVVVGPSASGARLESSKRFAKEFMVRNQIPTAKYGSFDISQKAAAIDFLKTLKPPFVLKADGLAAGKGVLIINDRDEAIRETEAILEGGKFGEAGSVLVIEEFLKGIEVSVFAITDGNQWQLLPEAKDYKRIGEGDTGLNTGGMGAVSPVPFADAVFMDKVKTRIIIPTIKGLQKESIDYRGVIFFGLMNVKGEPYVIEYNSRFGDPETEVIIPRIKSDLLYLFMGLKDETLSERDLVFDDRTAVTVMAVSGGYPGEYVKNKPITGADGVKDAMVFHAGTAERAGKLVTSGGRVMAVTALGKDLSAAMDKSYAAIERIKFDKMFYRKDIGSDLLK